MNLVDIFFYGLALGVIWQLIYKFSKKIYALLMIGLIGVILATFLLGGFDAYYTGFLGFNWETMVFCIGTFIGNPLGELLYGYLKD